MNRKKIKVAVTGAAGQIGYSLLFRLASGEVFGQDVEIELNLLELESALQGLKRVVMELGDCAFPLLRSINGTTDVNEAFKDVDWALLVGSVPRKAGMERSDLLKINSKVFVEQGEALSENASPDCRVLVVGNPCNTNAYIAKEICKNIPENNFFAMTYLDESRAKMQLAKKSNTQSSQITNMSIWGNHSATQYPDFYHARIDGKSALDVIKDESWLQEEFLKTVQQRGAEIIKKTGSSSAASAANAIVETVRRLTTPTEEGESFSVGVCSDGSYGIDKGLIFSFPVRSDGQKWEIIKDIVHNEWAQERIDASHQELLREKEAVSQSLTLSS